MVQAVGPHEASQSAMVTAHASNAMPTGPSSTQASRISSAKRPRRLMVETKYPGCAASCQRARGHGSLSPERLAAL